MMISRALRCAFVWLITTVLLLSIGWLAVSNVVGAHRAWRAGTLTGQSFETLLLWLCSVVLLGCCLWLWLTTSVMLTVVARGHLRTRVRGCPEVVRRTILLACGVAVAGTLALPVQAAPPGDQLAGLPLPDRTGAISSDVQVPASPITASAQAPQAAPLVVTVEAGDSLWGLAAESLGDGASAATIAERTQQLHDLNREVVGADPDRIFPGQHLQIPGGDNR